MITTTEFGALALYLTALVSIILNIYNISKFIDELEETNKSVPSNRSILMESFKINTMDNNMIRSHFVTIEN